MQGGKMPSFLLHSLKSLLLMLGSGVIVAVSSVIRISALWMEFWKLQRLHWHYSRINRSLYTINALSFWSLCIPFNTAPLSVPFIAFITSMRQKLETSFKISDLLCAKFLEREEFLDLYIRDLMNWANVLKAKTNCSFALLCASMKYNIHIQEKPEA